MFEIRTAEKMYASAVLNDNQKRIRNCLESVEKASLTVAAIITETEVYLTSDEYTAAKCADDFSNVAEWALDAFGFQKSSTNNYLRIGKYLIEPVKNDMGVTTGYRCKLKDANGNPCLFTYAQMIPMLKYVKTDENYAKLEEAVKKAVITPDMSSRKIIEALDKWFNPDKPDETAIDETATDENTNDNNDKTELLTVKDESGNTYLVPLSVIEHYKQEPDVIESTAKEA